MAGIVMEFGDLRDLNIWHISKRMQGILKQKQVL